MNHIPVTAAQKTSLQNRTMLLARVLERHIEGTNTIEAVVRAFNLLIDVEPDLDVARVYAHDRDAFTNLSEARQRTLIEDYRDLAFSPPDKIDPGAPKVETRIRMSVARVPLNSDPNDTRLIDLYEPLTPEDKIVSTVLTKRRRDEFHEPPKQGGTADWFDSAKDPSEWTPKAAQADLDAEIHFCCEDGSTYAARLWFDTAWPHPNTAWTAEVVRVSSNGCTSYMMHEQGCPRDNGAYHLTNELVRFLSVNVLPAFD